MDVVGHLSLIMVGSEALEWGLMIWVVIQGLQELSVMYTYQSYTFLHALGYRQVYGLMLCIPV